MAVLPLRCVCHVLPHGHDKKKRAYSILFELSENFFKKGLPSFTNQNCIGLVLQLIDFVNKETE